MSANIRSYLAQNFLEALLDGVGKGQNRTTNFIAGCEAINRDWWLGQISYHQASSALRRQRFSSVLSPEPVAIICHP
jgi:hypothetical protein